MKRILVTAIAITLAQACSMQPGQTSETSSSSAEVIRPEADTKVSPSPLAQSKISDQSPSTADVTLKPANDMPMTAEKAGANPLPPQADAAAQVSVTASCSFGFKISLDLGSSKSSQAVQSFTSCDQVAAKLNGQKFPTGKTVDTPKGGSHVKASCDGEGTLTLLANDSSSSIAMSMQTGQEKACLEMRNIINALKL